jgi:putative peptidoglycan lipid II flippase
MEADALNAAFVLPDMISYFLVGGAASITFVTILTRYRDTGREAEGERSLSVILTTMALVLGAADPARGAGRAVVHPLVVSRLRGSQGRALRPSHAHSAAGAALLLCRRRLWRGAAGAQAVLCAGGDAADLQPGHNSRRSLAGAAHRVFRRWPSARLPGRCGAISDQCRRSLAVGTRYRPILDWQDEGFREWVRLSIPLMIGVSLVTADNWIIAHFASATAAASR